MKLIKSSLFVLVTLFAIVNLQSCVNECFGIVCENGGVCVTGECDCPDGFSGTNCETENLCITQNPNCQNGGECVDGTCECPLGYEGDDCSVESRTKFIGSYQDSELDCGAAVDNLTDVSIEADASDPLKFTIKTFNVIINENYNMSCTLTSTNTFDIPSQTPCPGCFEISGTGSIDDNGMVTNNLMVSTQTCTIILNK